MRTISSRQAAVLTGAGRSEHLKVEIKDAGGTFRNMASYPGFDSVRMVSIREDIDSPHALATINLYRESDQWSVAPLNESAAANTDFGGSYAALLALTREVKISAAIEPADISAGVEWLLIFHGRIDTIDAGAGEDVVIECRDLGGALASRWIEKERVYSLGVVGGSPVSMRVWQPNTEYVLNEYVTPTDARRNISGSGRFYKVTTAGTSYTVEPEWSTSGVQTTGGGTAAFTYQGTVSTGGLSIESVIANVLADNGALATLYTPSSPGWNVYPWQQQREGVLGALRAIAAQLGWDVRYKWRSGTSAFELTLFEPDRSKASPDYTFSSEDYETIDALSTDISGIRNVITVIYSDPADTWPDATNTPKRKVVTREDATSISAYGRLTMEIAEDSSSKISTQSEAEDMADAILADLKEPSIVQKTKLVHGFPWVELGDLYEFTANRRHYTTDQDLAVVAYEHRWEGGRMVTTLDLRGQPAAGFDRWHRMDAAAKPEEQHTLTVFQAPAGTIFGAEPVVGGTTLYVTPPSSVSGAQSYWDQAYEYHVSATANFIPDATTLLASTKESSHTTTTLIPGAVYYAAYVPVASNGDMVLRGEKSTEIQFAAGRASSGHLSSLYNDTTLMVPNGRFVSLLDAAGPFDHWSVVSPAVWGASDDVYFGAGGDQYNGNDSLHLRAVGTSACAIETDVFQVPTGRYNLDIPYKIATSGSAALQVVIYWYQDAAGTASGTASTTHSIANAGTGGVYVTTSAFRAQSIPADARFAKVRVTKDGTDANMEAWIGEVILTPCSISQPGSLPLAYTNAGGTTWTDFGGGYLNGQYWKDSLGLIHLEGGCKRTAGAGTTIAVLPSGYRPSGTIEFPVATSGAATVAVVQIDSSGNIIMVSGNAAFISLQGLHFRT